MTYRHLISRRAALIREVSCLGAAVALVACGDGPTVPDDFSAAAAQLVAFPADPSIVPQQPTELRASMVSAAGDSTPAQVQWTLPDGGVLSDSLVGTRAAVFFRAAEVGRYRLVGQVRGGRNLADTSTVEVGAEAPLPNPTPLPVEPAAPPASAPAPGPPLVAPPAPIPALPPTVGSAELPRVYLDTRSPAQSGRTIRVGRDEDLQAVLDGAARGDVIELAAGATYTGNFVLPRKPGNGWIVIRTGTALPAEGTRATPGAAGSYARLVTPNSEAAVAVTGAEASGYRLTGVRIEAAPNVRMNYGLVRFGIGNEASTSEQPRDLVLDRVVILGHDQLHLQRCVVLNGFSSAVIDSWLAGCHADGLDAQAIIGWAGPGPFKIVNNYLEASGENIMFGGSDPKIAGMIPSDIEIRRNHIAKPLAWKSSNRWLVKNLYESKNSQRVLVEANIFENNWTDGQNGFAIVLKSENQNGRCTWCTTSDYTFRYNRIINSPGGIAIAGSQVTSNGGPSVPASRISILHTVFEKVAQSNQEGARRMFQIGSRISDLLISHNSGMPQYSLIWFSGANGSETGLTFRDNLFTRGEHGMHGTGMPEGNRSLEIFARGASVAGNLLIGEDTGPYPAGNMLVSTAGIVGVSTGDYAVPPGSPHRSSDGTPPGADIGALNAQLAGVRGR